MWKLYFQPFSFKSCITVQVQYQFPSSHFQKCIRNKKGIRNELNCSGVLLCHAYIIKKRTDIINLFIQTIHCDISKQARVADTVIHKVFNSIFLSVLFKLNAWECIDVFALKIKLNTWCYFSQCPFDLETQFGCRKGYTSIWASLSMLLINVIIKMHHAMKRRYHKSQLKQLYQKLLKNNVIINYISYHFNPKLKFG